MEAFNFKILIGMFGGVIATTVGGFDSMLMTLLVFIILDLITGFLKGLMNKCLDSRKMKRGIISKAFEMLIVVIAVRLDMLTGNIGIFRNMAVCFYIATECLSILENVGEFIDLPDFLKDFLEQLKETNNKQA